MFTWAFRAHNLPTLFGLGSSEQAATYLQRLNRNRALNEYRLDHALPGEPAPDAIKFLGLELGRK